MDQFWKGHTTVLLSMKINVKANSNAVCELNHGEANEIFGLIAHTMAIA